MACVNLEKSIFAQVMSYEYLDISTSTDNGSE